MTSGAARDRPTTGRRQCAAVSFLPPHRHEPAAGFQRMDDGRVIVVLDNTMSPAVAELQTAIAEVVYSRASRAP